MCASPARERRPDRPGARSRRNQRGAAESRTTLGKTLAHAILNFKETSYTFAEARMTNDKFEISNLRFEIREGISDDSKRSPRPVPDAPPDAPAVLVRVRHGRPSAAGPQLADPPCEASLHPSQDIRPGARPPQFAPRAKNVIFCYMSGGVSHVDSFDPKPRLERDNGKPMPMPIERTQFDNNGNLMASPWKFHNYGKSGIPVSDLFPQVGTCADELAVVRSMTAKFSEHAQGNYFMHTGFPFMGNPSAGAWVNYGLGSENRNLPGYVVLRSGGSAIPHGGVGLFSNGFLPAVHQASLIDADAPEPVRNIKPRDADPHASCREPGLHRRDGPPIPRHGGRRSRGRVGDPEL